MALIKFHVTLCVDDELVGEDYHADTMCRITETIEDLADDLDGIVHDLEMK